MVTIKRWTDGAVLREVNAANLIGADLSGANLGGANLGGANLIGANLRAANLREASLSWASLRAASLSGANLRAASLSGANLSGADLRAASLRWADLSGANLSGADLRAASLSGANLSGAKGLAQFRILPAGMLRGFKKLANGEIAELEIPAAAGRVNAYSSRKCRAEYAVVISGSGFAQYDDSFEYVPGATVRPREPFCDDPRIECASGIHFFITREEAEDF